ncbi:TerC family protein [Kistimonas scapharcae]|uniref:TerC family protein n=1 Tax=Kistimonas scapharcae TaxID=1036133 RepID=A0ABP8V8P1_9GAMM
MLNHSWPIIGFNLFVLAMLALDLYLHRDNKEVTLRHALGWSAVWVAMAVAFNLIIFFFWGTLSPESTLSSHEAALAFATGYLIEKSLSVDNLFVFAMIFSAFAVPRAYQHKVLFYGVVGALVMRGVMILAGSALIARYHWLLYVFGVLLIFTGIKMAMHKHDETNDISNSRWLKALSRRLPMTDGFRGAAFWVREHGRWMATPLLLVVLVVELSDLMFAIDSIPAIFAVTTDPFLVYTANVMALLGLRSLFFVLESLMDRFHYLNYGLAVMLSFVGVKMLLLDTAWAIPTPVSLLVIASVLGASIGLSLLRKPAVATVIALPPAGIPLPK